MSEQHTPDSEFVEYLENDAKNPYLSAPSVMQMERVFIDQRNKYEAKLAAHRMQEEVWEKTMMEVIGEDGPASVADAIRKLQDQAARATDAEPVDYFDQVISPAILPWATGEHELLVRRVWDSVRVACLSAAQPPQIWEVRSE